jgi:hypothetical protein
MTKKATWLQSKNWRLILQQFMKDGHCELCHLWSYFFKQSQYEKLYCISSWEEKNNSDVVIATKVFLKSKSQRFIYYCYSSILPGCLKALICTVDERPNLGYDSEKVKNFSPQTGFEPTPLGEMSFQAVSSTTEL